jgi:hypothetical protein
MFAAPEIVPVESVLATSMEARSMRSQREATRTSARGNQPSVDESVRVIAKEELPVCRQLDQISSDVGVEQLRPIGKPRMFTALAVTICV